MIVCWPEQSNSTWKTCPVAAFWSPTSDSFEPSSFTSYVALVSGSAGMLCAPDLRASPELEPQIKLMRKRLDMPYLL